jgi:hypothetical protein
MSRTRPGMAAEATVVLTEADIIPIAPEGADAVPAPDVGTTVGPDQDPTVLRGPARSAKLIPEASLEQVLVAEYVLIQMDDDETTRLEDVARVLSELALSRPPRAPGGARTTLQMRTFNVKAWMRSDGHHLVLEAQDDQQRTCSLIARPG